MENSDNIFKCLMCEKFKNTSNLEMLFNDGSGMCSECANFVRSGLYFYHNGKEVTPCIKCNGLGKLKNNFNQENYNVL